MLAASASAALVLTAFFASGAPRTAVDGAPAPHAAAETATSRPGASGQGYVEIRWDPAPQATLYNVVLWSNGERALDMWPKRATVRIPRDRLSPGSYQWFVYPWHGDDGSPSYGTVVAQGAFRA